jgi:hypothetical protein
MTGVRHQHFLENGSNRNQIFLGERCRGACRLSPGLHRTSQQQLQDDMQKAHETYVVLH